MDKVNYLLFRCTDYEALGGMRDLVSSYQSKEDLFDSIGVIINSSEFDSSCETLHFYDVRKDTTFDIKTKKSFEIIDDRDQNPTPTLGEMSGLADLKKEMKNS